VAKRAKKKTSKIVKARVSDERLILRLAEKAPEVLRGTIAEDAFDAAVTGLLKEKSRQDQWQTTKMTTSSPHIISP
jgi:hypothetical protein